MLNTILPKLIKSSLDSTPITAMPDDLDIGALIRFAHKQHMSVMLLSPLVEYNKQAYGAFLMQLATLLFISENQLHDLNEMQAAFEKAGIDSQALKGSVLKADYPRTELREMSDIDIVVREKDMARAGEILKSMGFEFEGVEEHHDIYKKANKVYVELHRSLYGQHMDKTQYEYFTSFKRSELVEGTEHCYKFNREDFYVYMIAHAARHFYARGCGVRNLVDIYVYINKYGNFLDRKYIDGELKKCGIYDYEKATRELAFAWLDEKELTPVQNTLLNYMLDSGIYGCEENGVWNKLVRSGEIAENETDSQIRRRYYFPSAEMVKNDYPWAAKCRILLPIAWLCRFCRAIFRKKSRKRFNYMSSPEAIAKAKDMQKMLKAVNLNFKTTE